MADIRAWAKAHAGPVLDLSDAVRTSFGLFIARLHNGSPRHVPCQVADHVVHVFTDGSSEADDHFIGGVIMVQGTLVSFFGCVVPDDLVKKWASSRKPWIGPIEAYAVAVARKAWHQYLAGRRCIFYVDNIPAQDAYVRGTSSNVHVREILLALPLSTSRDSVRLGHGSLVWRAKATSRMIPLAPLSDFFVRLVALGLVPRAPFPVVTLRTLWLPLRFPKRGEGGGRQTCIAPCENERSFI